MNRTAPRALRTRNPDTRVRTFATIVAAALVMVAVVCLWHPRSAPPKQRGPEDWSPAETLEAFIQAQESGDLEKTYTFVTKDALSDFTEAAHGMTKDDLVATGLQFRGDEYKVEETGAASTTFFSAHSALYLAMTKEEGRWKVDPRRTDLLNREQNKS